MFGYLKACGDCLISQKALALLAIVTICITGWQVYKAGMLPINVHIETPLQYKRFLHKEFMHVPKKRVETQISYDADSLPKWDYTTLINFTGFNFLIENTVCEDNDVVLIALHSAPGHIERRNSIRRTWGQPRDGMKLLFFVGAVDNQTKQNDLDEEDQKYHDIIQGNFMDAYKNLTYKHIMIFKYAVYYCPQIKYILKGDDDIYVNIEYVLEHIIKNMTDKDGGYQKDLIMCNIMDGSPTIRYASKWFVPFAENPHSMYPAYCSGYAVIYSYDVAFRLYREAQRGEYFWVDDAFVSGVLAKRLNIKHTGLPRGSGIGGGLFGNLFKGNFTGFDKNFWYGPPNIGLANVYKFWDILHPNTTTTAKP